MQTKIIIPKSTVRQGNRVDVIQLPNGCIIPRPGIIARYLEKRPRVKELILQAQKQTSSKRGVALSLIQNKKNLIDTDNQNMLDKNTNFAADIMEKRMESENLKESKKAHAKLQMLVA